MGREGTEHVLKNLVGCLGKREKDWERERNLTGEVKVVK